MGNSSPFLFSEILMKLDNFDIEELVRINKLPEVIAPFSYDRNGQPHPDGLYSTTIFGPVGSQKRVLQYAYIDLKVPFFHPGIFHAIVDSYKFAIDIMRGTKDLAIDKKGIISAKELGTGVGTGIQAFYDNWDHIKWPTGSTSRDDKIVLFGLLKKNEIFWSKFLVCPAFYRDMMTAKKGQLVSMDEVTQMYSRLISMCSLIDKEMDIFSGEENKFTIQNTLLAIHNFFTQKLAKKNGVIHKNLLGKTVDYAARTVISGPRLNCNHYTEQAIPFGYIGLPLHIVIGMFFPFFKESFTNTFLQSVKSKRIVIRDNVSKKKIIDEEMSNLPSEFVDTIVKRFARSYENRLDQIDVYDEFGKDSFKDLKAKLGRNITLTDIFFIEMQHVIVGKHSVSTRYPLEDYRNIAPMKIKIQVTEDTIDISDVYPGIKDFPVINPELDATKVKWVESTRVNNLFLNGWGGDYDGDMVSNKGVFSQEANEELDDIINNKIHYYVDPSGGPSRILGKELVQTLFNFTRRYD